MPFVDYLKKIFGINDSHSQSRVPSNNNENLDAVDRQTLDIQPFHHPSRNDGVFDHDPFFERDPFFEHRFQQLENLMRKMFGFPFGLDPPDPHNPFEGNDPFGSHPNAESGIFPSPGFPSIFGPGVFHRGIVGPTMDEGGQESTSPRDEVLKPSYRSTARHIKDEDFDDLVREHGPEVILDMLVKSEPTEQHNGLEFTVPSPRPDMSPRSFGKFSVVSGQSVQKQITRLPDGTFEERVTTTTPSGETITVITQHTTQDVKRLSRGTLCGGVYTGSSRRPLFPSDPSIPSFPSFPSFPQFW